MMMRTDYDHDDDNDHERTDYDHDDDNDHESDNDRNMTMTMPGTASRDSSRYRHHGNAIESNRHTTCMKIRGSVLSCFIFPLQPEDKITITIIKEITMPMTLATTMLMFE